MRIAPDGGLDVWRDAVRIIQAHEIWQVYGRFVEEKHPRFGPGVAERMQIASQDHQGARPTPRARCTPPPATHIRGAGRARHGRRAADRALHRAAARHAGRRSWNPTASA